MKCWNCLRAVAKKDYVCAACGQATRPNPMQATTAKSRLEYLLSESSEWEFLPPEVRQGLHGVYHSRLDRLETLTAGKDGSLWPGSDWTAPVWSQTLSLAPLADAPAQSAITERLDGAALDALVGIGLPIASPEPVGHQLADVPVAPLDLAPQSSDEPSESLAALRRPLSPPFETPSLPIRTEEENLASKVLAEADIRWFHSLGALLVVAAVVGWLRATWDGYGKNLAGVLILLSPAVLHAVAYQMRRSVPLSARLLAILAGLLTAPALLAVEVFDFLPPAVSGRDYWTLAFLISAGLLSWQARLMREKVPLYVGALCTVMAGWSQGALVTSVLCLILGFALGPVKAAPDASEQDLRWTADLQKVGLAAGIFGCFSTLFLFKPEQSPWVPLLAFTGALIYLHLPTLTRQDQNSSDSRVALQAAITVLGMVLMRWMLDVPAPGVGLYSLLAAGLFLSARPDHKGGLLALRVGGALGLAGLAVGFISQGDVPFGQPGADPAQTAMRFALAVVGAGLFGYLSRQNHLESQGTTLGLSALLSTLGGWYHLFLLFCVPVEGSYFRQNGQLAPLFASFGLWVLLWVVGSRWLRPGERDLVASVAAPVLLASIVGSGLSGLGLGLRAPMWVGPLLWLGAVSLLWEREILAPISGASSKSVDGEVVEDSPLSQRLVALLPRLALWALALGAACANLAPVAQIPVAMQLLALALLLSPARAYRQPALEMAWLAAPASFVYHWSNDPFPPQLLIVALLMVASWAAGPSKAASLVLAAGVGVGVAIGSLSTAAPAALLALPLAYGLCVALPVPGRGAWSKPVPAQHGFDLLLNVCLFLPLAFPGGSPQSFAVTVAAPILAFGFSAAARTSFLGRFISPSSAHWLLLAAFVWSLGQGPQESGLLMLLASGWALTLKEAPAQGLEAWDLANGLAILGAAWLLGESHVHPKLWVLAGGVLLSECLALASNRWRPNLSNTVFLLATIGLSSLSAEGSPEIGLALLAGLVGGLRGFATTQVPLMVAGMVTFLKVTDGQLSFAGASLTARLMPLAVLLICTSLWLLFRPEHPTRQALGVHPMASLRTGIALLALPPLLTLAVHPSFSDFVWVLAIGCGCLGLSQGFATFPELGQGLRQAGGYVLTGWACVSLGRAALALPWQLATLVVGLFMVAVGVKVERNRKKKDDKPS